MNTVAPVKGQMITMRGSTFTVMKVYPFGTMDVTNAKGQWFRVTGGSWLGVKSDV